MGPSVRVQPGSIQPSSRRRLLIRRRGKGRLYLVLRHVLRYRTSIVQGVHGTVLPLTIVHVFLALWLLMHSGALLY
jgi:hypothetical protein